MTVRVLVVDDSRFFRRRVTEILESDSDIKVIGSAENGREAINMCKRLKPDVITMDIEMPVMNGIDATREIMKVSPTTIFMFSSLTTDGAQATLDALDAGAVDFLPKKFEDISNNREEAGRILCERVKKVFRRHRPNANIQRSPSLDKSTINKETLRKCRNSTFIQSKNSIPKGQLKLLAIGTSTGGPVALQIVLSELPKNFPIPILLVQHMPGSFTTAFSKRLDSTCKIRVREAQDGDILEPGLALLAPGGKQMELVHRGDMLSVHVSESDPNQNYKPCVDITFESIAKVLPGKTLAVVMTGMGSDGRKGAKSIKDGGSYVWAQDEESCVVYGMPAAIVDAGLADQILPLNSIGSLIAESI